MAQYTDGRYSSRKVLSFGEIDHNITAGSEIARFKFFTNCVVYEGRATIKVVGGVNTAAITILKGTDSIGSIVTGTETAGSIVNASLTDTTFTSTDSLVLKNTNSHATAKMQVFFDYVEKFTVAD